MLNNKEQFIFFIWPLFIKGAKNLTYVCQTCSQRSGNGNEPKLIHPNHSFLYERVVLSTWHHYNKSQVRILIQIFKKKFSFENQLEKNNKDTTIELFYFASNECAFLLTKMTNIRRLTFSFKFAQILINHVSYMKLNNVK